MMKKEVLQERLQNHRDDLEAIELEIGKLEVAESFTHTQQIKTDWKDEIQDTIHQAVKTQLAYAHKKKEEIETKIKKLELVSTNVTEESGLNNIKIQIGYEDVRTIKLTGVELLTIKYAMDLGLELSKKRLRMFELSELLIVDKPNANKKRIREIKSDIRMIRSLSEKIKTYLPNRKEQGHDESN